MTCAWPNNKGAHVKDDVVLVYGGTGTQGSPVVEQLLAAGRSVRVLTRDAGRAEHWRSRGAEIVVADLGAPGTLAAANAGVTRVVLQLPLQYTSTCTKPTGVTPSTPLRLPGSTWWCSTPALR